MHGVQVRARGWGWRHAGRKAWALRGVDLDIAPGERVLLLGASGAGKSTLMGGLAGLLGGEDEGESSGELTLDGLSPAAARDRVGLVMQDPEAQVVLARLGDDVAFGCENLGVPRDEIWTRVSDSLDAVGLDLPLDHPTSKLSGGQKQRLALASVLAMGPQLLLLDEPTANLDPRGVAEVRAAAERVLERTGATLVVVEHRVDVWADLVDRAVVILDGTVAADGPLEEVLRDQGGRLREAGIWLPGDDRAVVGEAATRSAMCGSGEWTRSSGSRSRSRPATDTGTGVLGARDLTIGYDADHPVRAGVDLELRRGVSTCIVGGNGLGKSTLALTLVGLLPQLHGEVRVASDLTPRPGDTDPHDWSSHQLLGRLSMVFQEPEYQFVARTVREELEVGPRTAGVPEEEMKHQVDHFLRVLALEGVALANPMTLSGGEKRRLSVATALISAPAVVVLDEPTFGQDRATWLELVGILREAVEAGTTLVSITHDRSFVEAMGEEVIDLADVGWDPRVQGEAEDRAGSPSSASPSSGSRSSAPDSSVSPSSVSPSSGSDPGRPATAGPTTWRKVLRGDLLRRVNPVTQVLGLAVMTTPLMVTIDVLSASIALVLELLLLPLVGLAPRRLLVRLVPLFLAAPLAALSMLLYASPGGQVFWRFGPAVISENSVTLAAAILVRVLALGLPAIALLSRIDPTDMADGLGQVLRLPARPVLASLAGVRMAGLMVGDWHALHRARRVRGLGDGNRVAGFLAGAFALLVMALRRSAKLSLTMEARGFGADVPRTWARPSRVGVADAVMMTICVLIPVVALGAALHWGVFQLLGR
ncbi:MAG: ATP-binding cassette domain-containing protein [Actinomyces sp.]|nr:ATP-binding cassette domain-containing protein [Actinomyces sp.]